MHTAPASAGVKAGLERHADGHRLLRPRPRSSARDCALARTGPMGQRVRAVMPDSGASMANFIHTSRPMFCGVTASKPARLQASSSAVTPCARLAVGFRELEAAERADLLDHAGLRDVRADARDARHHVADPDDPADARRRSPRRSGR